MGDSWARRVKALYISLQEEGAEVREGIDRFSVPDISADELDASESPSVPRKFRPLYNFMRYVQRQSDNFMRILSALVYNFMRMFSTFVYNFMRRGDWFLVPGRGEGGLDVCSNNQQLTTNNNFLAHFPENEYNRDTK